MAAKIIGEKTVGGKRRVTVELNSDEEVIIVNPNNHYKLGAQMDDIVIGSTLTEASKVTWNQFSQEWEVKD